MNDKIIIRLAGLNDAQSLLNIYAPYITDTAVTFECEVPALEEFKKRIAKTLERYPYLVAETGGQIIGYVYASPLKNRRAYDNSAELSVYADKNHKGQGIGRLLYSAVEDILMHQNITNLYACVAYTDRKNDEYLNNSSLAFHERMGFKTVGHFSDCSFKFGRLYDVLWMEKIISANTGRAFVPFSEIK